MTDTQDGGPKPPPDLPKPLVDMAPPAVIGTSLWAVALVVSLLLDDDTGWWLETSIAGFALGLAGLSIVGWQRRASRRGSRGAQRNI